MDYSILTYPSVLASVFALMFLVTFATLLTVRKRLSLQDGCLNRLTELVEARELELSGSRTDAELAALHDEVSTVSRRLRDLANTQLEQSRVPGSGTMHDATVLARQGIGATQITGRCGISQGEAELLVRLHGPRSH